MTRKRFVKLLMGMGYSRNEAQIFAKNVQLSGASYLEKYYSIQGWSPTWSQWVVDKTADAVDKLIRGLKKVGEAAADAAHAFSAFGKNLSTEGDDGKRIADDDKAVAGVVCLPADGE